jgi:hypothetical protein
LFLCTQEERIKPIVVIVIIRGQQIALSLGASSFSLALKGEKRVRFSTFCALLHDTCNPVSQKLSSLLLYVLYSKGMHNAHNRFLKCIAALLRDSATVSVPS